MEPLIIFGMPSVPWKASDWTAQNDTLRGGSSTSYLHPASRGKTAVFGGFLDIKALGGAGFASQRTAGMRNWDLSAFDGLEIVVKRPSDEDSSDDEDSAKRITLVLKDRMFQEETNGKEGSTVSFEFSFLPNADGSPIWAPWREIKPFYRGRELKPGDEGYRKLNNKSIKIFSWMCRSGFGDQQGTFMCELVSVKAAKRVDDGDDRLDLENKTEELENEAEELENETEELEPHQKQLQQEAQEKPSGSRWAQSAQHVAEADKRCGVTELDDEMENAGHGESKAKSSGASDKPTTPASNGKQSERKCCIVM